MYGQSNTPFGSGGTFGQQQTNTAPAFGSPAPAPGGLFSSPAPAPFGAPAPSGFGGSTFAAPAPSGGGLFGPPAPAPAFGASSTFGAAPAPFGAPAPSGGLFRSTAATPAPTFGSPAPAPSIFGAPAPSATSAFGSTFAAPAPSTGFGGSGFGGSTMSTGTFGAPAPSGGGLFGPPAPAPAFGQPTPAPTFGTSSAFAQPAPAPAFGAPAPATGFGGFGTTTPTAAAGGLFGAQSPQQGGTLAASYQVTNKQDGTSSINLQAITAMQQYQDKSFEELRAEDYSQGNRGSQSSTPTTSNTGAFFGSSAPAPPGGLFGTGAAAPAPFGAPAPSGFGAPAPAPFGAPATGAFGVAAPAPFGAAPAPFGAPSPSGNLFGTPSPAPAPFGAPAPAGGSLFGTTSAAPAPFGAPAPAPFGAPAPAAFGAPAPAGGGLFGTSPAPAPFGAPAPPGGLFGSTPAPAPFGAPAPSGALFGPSPAPAPFGAPAPSTGGLFGGTPAPAPGGFGFGAPAPGGGPFGSPAPAPAFGGFGAPAPAPFGSPAPPPFGAPVAQPQGTGLPQNVQIIPPASNEVLAQQLRAMEQQKQELEKVKVWRGSTPKGALTTAASLPESEGLILPGRMPYSLYTASSPRSAVKIRPRGFPKTEPPKPSTPTTPAVGRNNSGLMSPETHLRSSVMHLVIKPDSLKKKPKLRLKTDSPGTVAQLTPTLPTETITSPPPDDIATRTQPAAAAPAPAAPTGEPTPSPRATQGATTAATSPRSRPASSPGYDYYQKVIGSTEEGADSSPVVGSQTKRSAAGSAVVPKLTKKGYEVSPSLESLSAMSEADLAAVPKFAVKRSGFGMVEWEGAVDVRGADLDRIVAIEPQDVSVYMLDEEEGTKPEVGSKLNRPAAITFYNVFPKSGPGADEEEKAKFERKVERNTKRIGSDLISYDRNTGEWKIRVQHFSRYALLDEDTDESDTEPSTDKHVAFQDDVVMKPKPVLKRKATPYKKPRFSIDDGLDMLDSVREDELNVVTDVELTDRDRRELVRTEADEAAAKLFAIVEDSRVPAAVPPKEAETLFFEEDDEDDVSVVDLVQPPSEDDIVLAKQDACICEKVMQETNLSSSAVDAGIRMGRSFRVGWCPDGSLLHLCPKADTSSMILKRTRPVCRMENTEADPESLLDTHLATAELVEVGDNSCPIFALPRSLQNAGSLPSHNKLYECFKRFGSVELCNQEAEAAFTLLACLLDVEENDDVDALAVAEFHGTSTGYSFSSRRNAGVLKWLKDLCSTDVDRDVTSAKARSDMQSAIFAALSGGDIEKACELASGAGMLSLAVVLSTDLEGRQDLLQQVIRLTEGRNSSEVRPETLRALEDLGGNLLSEENLFRKGASLLDWRRRLALRLLQEREEDLSSIIRQYNEEVLSAVAPFPAPRYLAAVEKTKIPSLLYRILSMVADSDSSLLEVVCPDGFSAAKHDFAVSFHLAAAISSTGISSLDPTEAEFIRYGYESQLISQGQWEWAVFVSLCSLGEDSAEGSHWKAMRAKDLIRRCFREDAMAQQRRDFLEKHVGIPPAWFDEALAGRSAYNGKILDYVLHTLDWNSSVALDVLESTYLPNMFFMTTDEIDNLMEILAAAAPDEGSLALAIYRFFLLKQRFEDLIDKEKDQIDEEIPELQENLQSIEQTLLSAKSRVPSHKIGLQLVPSLPKQVGLPSMISEALEYLEVLKLQLSALEQGLPIVSQHHGKRRLAAMSEQ